MARLLFRFYCAVVAILVAAAVLVAAASLAKASPNNSTTATAGQGQEQKQATAVLTTAELNNRSLAGAFSGGGAWSGTASAGTGSTSFDAGNVKTLGIAFSPPSFSPSSGPANAWGLVETDAAGFPLIGGGYQDQRVNYSPEALDGYATRLLLSWGSDVSNAHPDDVKVAYTAALCLLVPQFAGRQKLTRLDCED